MNVYEKIKSSKGNKKLFAVLIDPDKVSEKSLKEIISSCNSSNVDLILIGGSLLFTPIDQTILSINKQTNIPVLLFPGSLLQVSEKADGLLLNVLISGRNSEYLIGNHVVAAPVIRKSKLESISTGYILIDGGKTTSVEYISNTKPIPADKVDIAVATAMAGEMIGMKLIYLEAGSGAKHPVSSDMINEVSQAVSIPVIVGGGIKTEQQLSKACKAGADIIVVGTAIESDVSKIESFSKIIQSFN
jgi:putative glycerol-1-phosphate prenyltransferase